MAQDYTSTPFTDQPAGEPDALPPELEAKVVELQHEYLRIDSSLQKVLRAAIVAGLRAAPAAPREATEAMIEAGWKAYYATATPAMMPEIWRAMYDASRGEDGGSK